MKKTELTFCHSSQSYSGFTSNGEFVTVPSRVIDEARAMKCEDGTPFYIEEELQDTDLWSGLWSESSIL